MTPFLAAQAAQETSAMGEKIQKTRQLLADLYRQISPGSVGPEIEEAAEFERIKASLREAIDLLRKQGFGGQATVWDLERIQEFLIGPEVGLLAASAAKLTAEKAILEAEVSRLKEGIGRMEAAWAEDLENHKAQALSWARTQARLECKP